MKSDKTNQYKYSCTTCRKKNELYLLIGVMFILFFCIVTSILLVNDLFSSKVENLHKAFISDKELICSSNIISKVKGYRYESNKKERLTNDDKIFYIKHCTIR